MQSNKTKKLYRKLRRHQHTLIKETGVTCSENPTKYLGICNAGQINGLNEQALFENFHIFGGLDNILLLPGKSCCFLSFKSEKCAQDALEATNGTLNLAQDGKPLFLCYVEALPQLEDDKVYDRLPPGLQIIEDFISEEEEALLLGLVKFAESSALKHRQVKHYGYEFRYDINNVDKNNPLPEQIPSQCSFLLDRFDFIPDQLTVNCYQPGQGIPPHIDTHSAFEGPILSLSLNSAVIMEFKKSKTTICVLLSPRSLAVIAGESRYAWTHGITPRKFDFFAGRAFERSLRVSFTFRKVLHGDCPCNFPLFCDAKMRINECVAGELEQKHVYDVYEDIAGHFSETRHKPWPNVVSFVESLPEGALLVDVGCGNGKYFGLNKAVFELGLDRSFHLNSIARQRGYETFTANCLSIPLRDDVADAVISIAVIHHLSTKERRQRALNEMFRVLKVGGLGLVYVWAKQQVKNEEKSSYIKQDRKNRKSLEVGSNESMSVMHGVTLPVHINRRDFNHSDVLVPWKLKNGGGETFLRFYHVFEEGELEGMCEGVEIVKSYYDQGNYCIVFKK